MGKLSTFRAWSVFLASLIVAATLNAVGTGDGEAETVPSSPLRLAMVSLGGEPPVPTVFSDLLFVDLSGRQDLHLLERQEVTRVLAEQKLSLMTRGAVDANSAVKAGKILAADALLILELENHSKKPLLRTRLVDTRYGLKLFDGSLALPEKPEEYESVAKQLSGRATRHLRRTNIDRGQLLLVGVSSFLSEELSPEWDWLSDEIPKSIEQNMGLYPGVVLLERKTTRPLTEERELAVGLPEALQAAAILINGSYRIQDGEETVSVRVRARRQAVTLAEETFQTPLDTVGSACAQAAKRLLGQLRSSLAEVPMDAREEAEMLAAEARAYLDRDEANRAFPAAEAALALVPDSFAYMELVIGSLTAKGGILYPLNRNAGDPRALLPYNWRLLNLSRTMLRKCPLPPLAGTGEDWTDEEWQCHVIHSRAYHTAAQFLRPRNKDPRYYDDGETVDIFYPEFWKFFEEAKVRYAERPRLLAGLITQFTSQSGGISRAGSIEEAIRKTDDLVLLEARTHRVWPHKCLHPLHSVMAFYHAFYQFREQDPKAGAKGLAHLEKLMQSPDAFVRMEALRYGLQYYTKVSPSQRKRRKLAAAYVEASSEAGRPNPNPILGLEYDADAATSQQIEMGFIVDLIDHALENGISMANGRGWTEAIFKAGSVLEHKKGAAEALDYYERVAAACDDRKFEGRWQGLQHKIDMLKEANPELAGKDYLANVAKPVLLLRAEDVSAPEDNTTVDFSRICLDDDQPLVIYTRGKQRGGFFGVIRFNAGSRRVVSITGAHDIRHDGWQGPGHSFDWDLHVVNFEGDVTLAGDYAGIATLGTDGSLTRLPPPAVDLPRVGVLAMARLNERLFCVVGRRHRVPQALVEVDIHTGESKIICSSREDPAEGKSHMNFLGLAVDSRRNLLWFISRIHYSTHQPDTPRDRLFSYHPETDELKQIHVPELDVHLKSCAPPRNGQDGLLRLFGNSLLIDGTIGLCEFNVATQETRFLCAKPKYHNEKGEWLEPWLFFAPDDFARVEDGVVSISERKLVRFKFGRKEPIIYPITLFRLPTKQPEKDSLWDHDRDYPEIWRGSVLDFAPSPGGLYVLTRDALWLVPDIKTVEDSRDEASL
ncbi:MAG: hypothetical protein RRC34_04140 [Lentisphaeria bacterium]|nr:hypothetical protein [Lentisphaeria bacterium]